MSEGSGRVNGVVPVGRSGAVAATTEIEGQLQVLAQRAEDWGHVGLRERVGFLHACMAGVRAVARAWVERSCAAQGIAAGSPAAGELWLSGPAVTLRSLRLLAESLERGARRSPAWRRRRGEQEIVGVTPLDTLEAALLRGVRAEVWIRPGYDSTQGRIYRCKERGEPVAHGVALVLGAGNVSSIAPRDLAHKLFVEDQVVMLKMHPVNEYLAPLFERAFAPLIEAGYLAICKGGADVGRFLCRHELIQSIHLTGSHHTFDAIVWGEDEAERERRRAADDPIVRKPVTAELGCVSPVLVVPGAWSERELDFQARSVAGMVVNNASFNCNAAKLLVVAAGWPQREAFLERLRRVLAAVPPRRAYYPGAAQRYRRFVERYAQAEVLGEAPPDALPWTLVADVPARPGEPALTQEAFCGVLAEVALPAADPAEFLERAVPFVNEQVWGSLSCMLIVGPRTARALGDALEGAIAGLRYGGVAVNAWSGYLFGLAAPSWGAYPGNTPRAVGSGIGTVGNALLFDHPERSVLWAPFVAWPRPPWFPDHRTLETLGRRLTAFEARPAWRRLPAVAWTAARG